MSDHVTAPTRTSQIMAFVENYLDRMPPMSRVTFEDLVPYVCKECKCDAVNLVRATIHEILKDHKQFAIMRGRGICKMILEREFDVEAFCKDSDPPPAKVES